MCGARGEGWLALTEEDGTYDGNEAEVERLYKASLKLFHELGAELGIVDCFVGLGAAARSRGQVERAIWLLAQAKSISERRGISFTGWSERAATGSWLRFRRRSMKQGSAPCGKRGLL